MSSWILFLKAGWFQFSVRCSVSGQCGDVWQQSLSLSWWSELGMWKMVVVYGKERRYLPFLRLIVSKKNIRFHIPNLNAVSDVQWVRMFDSSLPIRKLLFRGRRVLAETKTKVWTFAIFVPQWREQHPTSIASVKWNIEIHQMICWMFVWML